jgi:hypothetical protein
MPEYSAFEMSEMRQKQMVEQAVKKSGVSQEKEFDKIELKADKQRIHEALKNSRGHHTIRVGSKLP